SVGLGEQLLEVPEGTQLVLDGDQGALHVDPSPELVREYERKSAERAEDAQRALASARRPPRTRDGRRIEIVANVGSPEDVDAAVANGAEGVGLLRTEFLFLERDSLPDEDEQHAAHEAAPLPATAGGGEPLPRRAWNSARPHSARASGDTAAGGPARRGRASAQGHVPDGQHTR